ncbi:MAG: protein phosphatase 2C domain-containing protein [Acidobacteriia bacterium]|nr:protein phosphatase 2C domain-containing protein [Terriglobia bacterium]
MVVESAGLTDSGCVRPENEDRILVEPDAGLFVVCDGMGGPRRGDVAAETAIETIRHFILATADRFDVTWPFGYKRDLSIAANRLLTAILLANHQVWRRAEQAPEHAGMGATVAALLLEDNYAAAANVGDSRVYRLRAGCLRQLTVDDTIIADMLAHGIVSAEASRRHPMRNILTQAAGAKEKIEVHLWEEAIEPGDVFLISSDGLHKPVPEEDMRASLSTDVSAAARAGCLIEAARVAGGPDNVSAVVVACE